MDPLRILFLDIDGVLNSSRFFRGSREEAPITKKELESFQRMPGDIWTFPVNEGHREGHFLLSYRHIDPRAVSLLNQVVDAGAKVVVSSVWRKSHTLEGLQWLLQEFGFRGEIIGTTPDLFDAGRGREILAWLKECPEPVHSFAVVDDDIQDLKPVLSRLTKTTFKDGFLPEHVPSILENLQRPWQPTDAGSTSEGRRKSSR